LVADDRRMPMAQARRHVYSYATTAVIGWWLIDAADDWWTVSWNGVAVSIWLLARELEGRERTGSPLTYQKS